MMCEPETKATMLGSLFALSQCATLLWLPGLADKFGRRNIFVVTRVIDCLLYTVLLISRDYTITMICLIGLGAATPGRLNVGIPYLNEWFPKRRQTLV